MGGLTLSSDPCSGGVSCLAGETVLGWQDSILFRFALWVLETATVLLSNWELARRVRSRGALVAHTFVAAPSARGREQGRCCMDDLCYQQKLPLFKPSHALAEQVPCEAGRAPVGGRVGETTAGLRLFVEEMEAAIELLPCLFSPKALDVFRVSTSKGNSAMLDTALAGSQEGFVGCWCFPGSRIGLLPIEVPTLPCSSSRVPRSAEREGAIRQPRFASCLGRQAGAGALFCGAPFKVMPPLLVKLAPLTAPLPSFRSRARLGDLPSSLLRLVRHAAMQLNEVDLQSNASHLKTALEASKSYSYATLRWKWAHSLRNRTVWD